MEELELNKEYKRDFNSEQIDNVEENMKITLSICSDTPILRKTKDNEYYEVLVHSNDSIDFTRLNADCSVLFNHDKDRQIAVVRNAVLVDNKIYAEIEFSKNDEFAVSVYRDIKDDIRKNVSVAYTVQDARRSNKKIDGIDVIEITRFQIYEVSIVTIPADISVGVKREYETEIKTIETTETVKETVGEIKTQISIKGNTMDENTLKQIEEIGRQYSVDTTLAKSMNMSVEQFKTYALDSVNKRSNNSITNYEAKSFLGLTESDKKRYSITNAINSMLDPFSHKADFERSISKEIENKLGVKANGIFIPYHDLRAGELTTTAGAGAIATDTRADMTIEYLRNSVVLNQLGATVLTGLSGNISIPKYVSGSVAYEVAETNSPTMSELGYEQVNMSPVTVVGYTEYTRQMFAQSSISLDNMIMTDLSSAIANKIDSMVFFHSTKGIKNISGVSSHSVSGSFTYTDVTTMQFKPAEYNAAFGQDKWVVSPAVVAKLAARPLFSGTGMPIYDSMSKTIGGVPTIYSNAITSGHAFFGSWDQLVVGMWGVLDLQVNPYSKDNQGIVRIVGSQMFDWTVRHPKAFVYCANFA